MQNPSCSVYVPTVRNGKSNPWRLRRILGKGAEILEYQRRRGYRPAFYYPQGDSSQRVYSFSQIKNTVASVFDPYGKETLQAWRDRVGENEANRICSEAKTAGEMGHRMLENWSQHKPLGICPMNMTGYKQALESDILPYLRRGEPGLTVTDDNGEVIVLSEVFVADFEQQFIGRLDLVTRISVEPFNDLRVLLELKGSGRPKRLAFMEPHIIQGVAYQSTFNKIAAAYPHYLDPLDGVALAYIYQGGNGAFIPIFGEELEEYEQIWQQWLDCFHDLMGGNDAA